MFSNGFPWCFDRSYNLRLNYQLDGVSLESSTEPFLLDTLRVAEVVLVYCRGARSGAGVEIGTRRSGLCGSGPKPCRLHVVRPKPRETRISTSSLTGF